MASDDVPPHEMFRPSGDPLDAALRDGSDDPALDVLVSDLRAAYLPEGTRPRSAELAAFAGTGDGVPVGAVRSRPAAVAVAPVPIGRRAAVAAAAFAATITGKVVLGGAVAAAALGGLHATETVEVPLLPRSPQAETVPANTPDLPDAVDPLSVLVGPPAHVPSDAVERTPAPHVPAAGDPDPAAPPAQADRRPSTADPADVDERRGEPATPPAAPAPAAPAGPPATAGPSEPAPGESNQAPAVGAPKGTAGRPPSETDPADGPDRQPPAPTTDEQRTSARP